MPKTEDDAREEYDEAMEKFGACGKAFKQAPSKDLLDALHGAYGKLNQAARDLEAATERARTDKLERKKKHKWQSKVELPSPRLGEDPERTYSILEDFENGEIVFYVTSSQGNLGQDRTLDAAKQRAADDLDGPIDNWIEIET